MARKLVRGTFTDYISSPGSGYTVFDRDHTDLLVKELGEQRSVLYNEKSAKDFGKRLGVQFVCISELTREESDLYIECKLINVETGAVRTESELTNSGNAETRKASVAVITRLLGKGGAATASAAPPAAQASGPVMVSIDEIRNEYQNDEVAAKKKYKGKRVGYCKNRVRRNG
jgi:hypothetical protein